MNRSQKITEYLINHELALLKSLIIFLAIYEGIFFIFILFSSPLTESLFLVLTVIIIVTILFFWIFMYKLRAPLYYYRGRYRKFLGSLSEKYPEITEELRVEMDRK